MPNKNFDCCANCNHYDQYYHESGWCNQPDREQQFPRGLMVYAWNGCDQYNDGTPRERQVDEDYLTEQREARAEAAFEKMRESLGA